jgi:FlaA1/EpsC-like NDP-sugar epimerase
MLASELKQWLLQVPRGIKQLMAVANDLVMCGLAAWLALSLRLDAWQSWGSTQELMLLVGAVIALPIFAVSGLYQAIFRYAGLPVLYTMSKALSLYTLVYAVVFTVFGVASVPRSMGVMQPVLFALSVIASRLFVRHWLGGYGSKRKRQGAHRALIYGAGSAGRQLATGMSHVSEVLVVGYVDDDERLHGQVLNGLPIYNPKKMEYLVAKRSVTQLYLALPNISRRRRNEVIQGLLHLKLQVRTLPGLVDLTQGRVKLTDLKELDIEDLLGRDPVSPNPMMMAKNNTGKVVLITGAGGSIGSELCRQILRTSPARLLLVELTEFALYAIEQELRKADAGGSETASLHGVELLPLLADVRDEQRMSEIMRTWRPDTVYHAAAYKHVPLVEHNPVEGVRNNVFGTRVVAEQAMLHGVKDFVLISTDKAVRPANIMGASKRLAEMVLQAFAEQVQQQGSAVRFSMVRFGNVLGSSGSVVPLFRRQIQQGGPVTLTDERITRYFMTIPEAAQLVIQAGAMASGGDVFVLDMGESVKIIDLAKRMIELSGLTLQDEANPEGDVVIQVTGLRPGEKLYEELLIGDNPMPTPHSRIMKAREAFLPWSELRFKLDALRSALDANDVTLIRAQLKELVSGYKPDDDVVDWVWAEKAKQIKLANA